jgi:hypothetical protein
MARGLMQVTDWTVKILKDENGELKNHFVFVDQKDMKDPNLNIASGIRWLFRKKDTASAKLSHEASWEDAIWDYKGFLDRPNKKAMENFRDFYRRLLKP